MDIIELYKLLENRSAKIASIFCLTTEILPQNEPLRLHVRNEAVKLISNSVSFVASEAPLVMQNRQVIRDSIGQLRAAAGLLRDINIINGTTYSVLENELLALRADLEEVPQDFSRGIVKSNNHLTSSSGPSARGTSAVSSKPTFVAVSAGHGNKERRGKILELLSERGPSSVSDLAQHIEGCSDKTIQRELVSMLSSGLINKTGERRWSRYSLSA